MGGEVYEKEKEEEEIESHSIRCSGGNLERPYSVHVGFPSGLLAIGKVYCCSLHCFVGHYLAQEIKK